MNSAMVLMKSDSLHVFFTTHLQSVCLHYITILAYAYVKKGLLILNSLMVGYISVYIV